jgi:branched-chain amino acid transport system permease protein
MRNGRVLLVIVLVGLPFLLSPAQAAVSSVAMIYAMVGLSLLVLSGWSGQISLGQFAFSAVGAYLTAVLMGHASFPAFLAVAIGAIAGARVAVVVGLPALKLRGLHLAVTTLAFAVAMSSFLFDPKYLGQFLPREVSRPAALGLDLDDPRTLYYFSLLMLVLVVVGVVGLRRSRFGRALIAARDNEQAAQSYGIGIVPLRLGAFAISGFIAALAGGIFTLNQAGADGGSFRPGTSVTVFLLAVIGGLGSISGPLLGGLYFLVVSLFSTDPVVLGLFTGVGLLGILLALPGGLCSVYFIIRDAALRRLAVRNRILVPALFANARAEVFERPRAAIAPKTRSGGGTVFVAPRYRLDEPVAGASGAPRG